MICCWIFGSVSSSVVEVEDEERECEYEDMEVEVDGLLLCE